MSIALTTLAAWAITSSVVLWAWYKRGEDLLDD